MGLKPIVTAFALTMGFGILWASPALPGGSAAVAAEKKAKDDPSRRVCRNLTPTGSRLIVRTCRTQAEWDKSAAKASESLLQHQINETSQLQQGRGPL